MEYKYIPPFYKYIPPFYKYIPLFYKYIPLFYTTFVKNISPRNTLQDTLEMNAEIHTGLLLCLIIEVRRDWSVFESCNTVGKH
jgi:hypothetical protein